MTQVQSAPADPKMLIAGLWIPLMRLTWLTYLTWHLEMNRPQNLKMNQEFLAVPTVDQQMIFPTHWPNGSSTGTSGCWFLIGTFAQMLSMFQNAIVASVKSWRRLALRSKINYRTINSKWSPHFSVRSVTIELLCLPASTCIGKNALSLLLCAWCPNAKKANWTVMPGLLEQVDLLRLEIADQVAEQNYRYFDRVRPPKWWTCHVSNMIESYQKNVIFNSWKNMVNYWVWGFGQLRCLQWRWINLPGIQPQPQDSRSSISNW